jgi:hypothetical protein
MPASVSTGPSLIAAALQISISGCAGLRACLSQSPSQPQAVTDCHGAARAVALRIDLDRGRRHSTGESEPSRAESESSESRAMVTVRIRA